MLATCMVCLSLALEGLSEFGLRHATVMVLMAFGMAGLVSYALHASRVSDPLFSLDLFQSRTFSIGLAGNMFARIGSSGMAFLLPFILQISLGYRPLEAGLMMVPVAFGAVSPNSPWSP